MGEKIEQRTKRAHPSAEYASEQHRHDDVGDRNEQRSQNSASRQDESENNERIEVEEEVFC